MSQNTAVIICPSADGTTCNNIQDNNWGSNRIIVFSSSTGQVNNIDHIITTMNPPDGNDYLDWRGAGSLDLSGLINMVCQQPMARYPTARF